MTLLKRKRIGTDDAMSVVTKFVNACNRHDADGVGACLHPDFDSIQPMYPNRNFRGADQVRRNWQAIFDAEPGFRLTVLRSASTDDTIWLELHGAGRDAEVAGVFVMGIQGDRIRWARIYSALVEPVAAGAGSEVPAAPLGEVRSADEAYSAGGDAVVEDALLSPVRDIGTTGRRRRRRRGADEDGTEGEADRTSSGPGASTGESEGVAEAAPATVAIEPDIVVTDVVVTEPDVVVVIDADPVEVVEGIEDADQVGAADQVEAARPEPDAEIDPDVVVVEAEAEAETEIEPEAVVVVEAEPEVVPFVVVEDDDGGPPTQAVEMVALTASDADAPPDAEEGDSEPAPAPGPAPPPPPPFVATTPVRKPPTRWFGKKPRP